MIVEKILGTLRDFEGEPLKIDKVLLDHYDMEKPHQKLKSQSGSTIAVSLEHGERLFCGAVLYRDDETLIAVDLLPEDALEIRPKGTLDWAKIAFNIGNMHHPAYLNEECIVTPYDAVLEAMLQKAGVEYRRCERQLTGERANYGAGGGHHHHHGEETPHRHHHQEAADGHSHSHEGTFGGRKE